MPGLKNSTKINPVANKARLLLLGEKKVARKMARTEVGKALAEGVPVILPTIPRAMTPKQLAFIKAWAQGETIGSASVRAGYQDNGACGYIMAKDPHVLALYHREKKAWEAAVQMTRKQVMDGLLEGIELAKMMSEPAQVIAGWREIGKMCGYYEPKKILVDVNHRGEVEMTLKTLERKSDEDLLKIIKGEEAQDVDFSESVEDDSDD